MIIGHIPSGKMSVKFIDGNTKNFPEYFCSKTNILPAKVTYKSEWLLLVEDDTRTWLKHRYAINTPVPTDDDIILLLLKCEEV
jgi:hypothetical protein